EVFHQGRVGPAEGLRGVELTSLHGTLLGTGPHTVGSAPKGKAKPMPARQDLSGAATPSGYPACRRAPRHATTRVVAGETPPVRSRTGGVWSAWPAPWHRACSPRPTLT